MGFLGNSVKIWKFWLKIILKIYLFKDGESKNIIIIIINEADLASFLASFAPGHVRIWLCFELKINNKLQIWLGLMHWAWNVRAISVRNSNMRPIWSAINILSIARRYKILQVTQRTLATKQAPHLISGWTRSLANLSMIQLILSLELAIMHIIIVTKR